MKATKQDLETLTGGCTVKTCDRCNKKISSNDVEIISEKSDKYGIWYNYSCKCVEQTTTVERWKKN